VLDLEPFLTGPVFRPLVEDYGLLRAVTVDAELGTIVWPNGADIPPRTLSRTARCAETSSSPTAACTLEGSRTLDRGGRTEGPGPRRPDPAGKDDAARKSVRAGEATLGHVAWHANRAAHDAASLPDARMPPFKACDSVNACREGRRGAMVRTRVDRSGIVRGPIWRFLRWGLRAVLALGVLGVVAVAAVLLVAALDDRLDVTIAPVALTLWSASLIAVPIIALSAVDGGVLRVGRSASPRNRL
jgi:hypothetical protein